MKLTNNSLLIPIKKVTTIDDILNEYHQSKKNKYLLYMQGNIKVNEKIVKQSIKLNRGDVLEITFLKNEEQPLVEDPTYIDIVYEDELFLIVNKPSGLLVHSDGVNTNKTLCNQVQYYYNQKHYDIAVRPIHRLDVDTSGIVMFCKINFFQAYLDYLLSEKLIAREYDAFVVGNIARNKIIIEANIGKDRHNSKKMFIHPNGKYAKSEVTLIKNYQGFAHVHVKLFTGRTHQIRVHMKHINHPLLSDPLYGTSSKFIKRLALHASSISFYHPIKKENVTIKCSLSKDLLKVIK